MSFKPLACVLGDMDLVRPLGIAGIDCAVAVQPGAPPRFSRYTRAVIDWASPWEEADTLVRNLIDFGKTQSEAPVLFYESDGELLLVSRYRKQLGEVFRFVVPDQTLVENLVDKERFQELAIRLSLPVPPARRLHPEGEFDTETLDLQYPVIIKPLTRRPELWRAVTPEGKALRLNSAAELARLWPKLAASGVEVLAQELIDGPETRIESYHVYVNDQGEIVGEFTGRKIRTFPVDYGDSTALITTDAPDVLSLGRELVHRIGLQGVAKFDFKRAADGTLFLLEINPRFNLWHHLGALAGVNLPALVFSDLTGQPRRDNGPASAGLAWCRVWQDVQAAKALQIPLRTWLAWAFRCDAKRLLAWNDPKPFVFAGFWRGAQAIRSRISRKASHLVTSAIQPDLGSKTVIGASK
ncbi:MAG TPA: ATP-grasp domain-containing protein [Pyrinomonadaceae bacterium]|nr:ATP-grasp domain-containing protein [Pyrinomonadaceae bacterium]